MTYPSLLPPNSTKFERDMEQVLATILDVPIEFEQLWQVDNCPKAFLPWLAWTFSVDYWNSNWSEEKQREVIRNSLYIHQHKGTLAAVKRALLIAEAPDAEIIEWFDYGGKPKTFQLILPANHPAINTGAKQKELLRLVFDAKPVAAHIGSPHPADDTELVQGLKITQNIELPEEVNLILAGNVHDLRKPSYTTEVTLSAPNASRLIAQLIQDAPIPLHILGSDTATLSYFTVNNPQLPDRSRYVNVFKPVPEGEISAGKVTVSFESILKKSLTTAHRGYSAFEALQIDAGQLTTTTELPLTVFSDDYQSPVNQRGDMEIASQVDFFSLNLEQPIQYTEKYVHIFRPLPEGDLGIGQVTVNYQADNGSTLAGTTFIHAHWPTIKGLLSHGQQGVLFSLGIQG